MPILLTQFPPNRDLFPSSSQKYPVLHLLCEFARDIEQNLPNVGDAAEIPETFDAFWEAERAAAFDQLCKEEQLDADKLKKVIDRYVYTGKEPLPDPDIIELIHHPLKLAERGPTRKRVLEKVMEFVTTFIRGIAA